jgi:hypothetical protein
VTEELESFIDTAKAVIFASMCEEVGAFSSLTTHGRGYLSLFCKEMILN